MVLEMKIPRGASPSAIESVVPEFLIYALSFANVGIYWNNHHHLLYAVEKIDGRVMWANLLLLFWLSLIPFTTGWMGVQNFALVPTAVYGMVLFLSAVSWVLLQSALISANGSESTLARAVGRDVKGIASLVMYAVGIGVSYVNEWVAIGMYVLVAVIWIVPDLRIERAVAGK